MIRPQHLSQRDNAVYDAREEVIGFVEEAVAESAAADPHCLLSASRSLRHVIASRYSRFTTQKFYTYHLVLSGLHYGHGRLVAWCVVECVLQELLHLAEKAFEEPIIW